MHKGRLFRLLGVCCLSATFLVGGALGAWAVTKFSEKKIVVSNGNTYNNQAIISEWEDPTDAKAYTLLDRVSSGETAGGNMGVKARSYLNDGSQCGQSVWVYNSVPATSLQTWVWAECGGWVYSRGRTETWNGSSMDLQNTYKTDSVYPN